MRLGARDQRGNHSRCYRWPAEFEVRVLGVPGDGEVDAIFGGSSPQTATGAITHVADTDGTQWTRFGVVSQPSFAFVDRSGGARGFAGSLDGEQLRPILDVLV